MKPFLQEEHQALLGCLLGDGTLTKAGKNYRLRVEHQAKHEGYVEWKHRLLNRFCLSVPRYVRQHNSYRFGTVGHPELTELRNQFYSEYGKKHIPQRVADGSAPITIAIWFMDDGYRIHRTAGIAVHSFSPEDINILRRMLGRYEIRTRIQQDGHGPRIYITTESYKTFKNLVKPYVWQVPCMAYKIV